MPRIFVSANSGARIGLAEEIKHLLKVAWNDPSNKEKVHSDKYIQVQMYVHRHVQCIYNIYIVCNVLKLHVGFIIC